MALHKLVFISTLTTILLAKGCLSQLNVCGKARMNTKIIGGVDATPGSWPWQVSLHFPFGHFCGGSLINKEWVLTAAHCFESTDPANLTVYLGRHSQEGPNPNEVKRRVTHIIPHPHYKDLNNDMCLLKLASPVTFTDYISPVCLAAPSSTFHTGTLIWVTGWGYVDFNNTHVLPDILQEVEIPIVGNKQCDCSYDLGGIQPTMLCAGISAGGKDSCQGDSGGPLVVKQNQIWVQAGVVSFGKGCGLPDIPGVYARVSMYHEWISGHVTNDPPGFVFYDSLGMDDDDYFRCPLTTEPPMVSTTEDWDSIFDDGARVHFSYLTLFSLLTFVLSMYTMA